MCRGWVIGSCVNKAQGGGGGGRRREGGFFYFVTAAELSNSIVS